MNGKNDAVDSFFDAVGGGPTRSALPPILDDATFLHNLAYRLRTARTRRGMSRRLLAEQSGISQRYLADVEAGIGNASILSLRAIARSLGVAPGDLLDDRADSDHPLGGLLARLTAEQLHEAHALLSRHFTTSPAPGRDQRIALIGLRGAGKSSLGRLLAAARGVRFFELDREIEQRAGTDLREIFERHGQSGFRRLEREVLERLLAETAAAVIAAGGGIVATPATYHMLTRACRIVWVRASPEEHMARVLDQGDNRPMQDNRKAMDDLRAILASRDSLYARADLTLDTSGETLAESFVRLTAMLV